MGNLGGTLTAERATSAEEVLAEMLAGVMKIEQVPVHGHFFADLGADSLVMAKYVYDEVTRSGELHVIDDFFHELSRYGTAAS
jgi:hypothetical protein